MDRCGEFGVAVVAILRMVVPWLSGGLVSVMGGDGGYSYCRGSRLRCRFEIKVDSEELLCW